MGEGIFFLIGFAAAVVAGLLVGVLHLQLRSRNLAIWRVVYHAMGVFVTALVWHLWLRWLSPIDAAMPIGEHFKFLKLFAGFSLLPWFTAGWGTWVIISVPARREGT